MVSQERRRKKRQNWKRSVRNREADTNPELAAQRAQEHGDKICHPDEAAANRAAASYERTHGEPMNVYRCRWCPCWHIGHLGKRRPPERRLMWVSEAS